MGTYDAAILQQTLSMMSSALPYRDTQTEAAVATAPDNALGTEGVI